MNAVSFHSPSHTYALFFRAWWSGDGLQDGVRITLTPTLLFQAIQEEKTILIVFNSQPTCKRYMTKTHPRPQSHVQANIHPSSSEPFHSDVTGFRSTNTLCMAVMFVLSFCCVAGKKGHKGMITESWTCCESIRALERRVWVSLSVCEEGWTCRRVSRGQAESQSVWSKASLAWKREKRNWRWNWLLRLLSAQNSFP